MLSFRLTNPTYAIVVLPSVSGLKGSLSDATVTFSPVKTVGWAKKIKDCAWVLIESDGEYPAAAAALLVCYKLVLLICLTKLYVHGLSNLILIIIVCLMLTPFFVSTQLHANDGSNILFIRPSRQRLSWCVRCYLMVLKEMRHQSFYHRLIRLSAFSVMLYRGGYQSDVSAAVVAMVVCTYSCFFLNNNKANTPTENTRSERPLSAW
jgi:hypothetical protein